MRSAEAAPLARRFARADDAELRRRASYVLGWTGDAEDLDLLRELLLADAISWCERPGRGPQPGSRSRPRLHAQLVANLSAALAAEREEAVLAMIVSAPGAAGASFGLREISRRGVVVGDVVRAVEQARRAIDGDAGSAGADAADATGTRRGRVEADHPARGRASALLAVRAVRAPPPPDQHRERGQHQARGAEDRRCAGAAVRTLAG